MLRVLASQAKSEHTPMINALKNQKKVLELNPKSPLVEGLLERLYDLSEMDEEDAENAGADVRNAVRILIDTTMVRSGYPLEDVAS